MARHRRASNALIAALLAVSACLPVLAAGETGALTDAEVERILREGRVLSSAPIPTGKTQPHKLGLELDGRIVAATFKTYHDEKRGTTRIPGHETQTHFTDSYRYEPMAYRLDRELGLGLVPVSVIRTIDGREGAVVHWIEGVMTEAERRDRQVPLTPELVRQRRIMKVFDALVFNADRNLGNSLYDTEADRLWLIDHTRCFALNRTLLPSFESGIVRLSRDLAERLGALDMDRLETILGDGLSRARAKALLARRDRILEKVAEDREIHGDDVVFAPETDEAGD